MTPRKVKLPAIPAHTKLSDLKPNMKLYSEEEIANIKQHLTANDKYHSYTDADGEKRKLPFTVFVFNGKYFASYPNKKSEKDFAQTNKTKFAQDLDTGEWICVKVLTEADQAYAQQELEKIKSAGLAIEVENEAAYFSISKKPASSSIFGNKSGMFKAQPAKQKYYIFMRYQQCNDLVQALQSEIILPAANGLTREEAHQNLVPDAEETIFSFSGCLVWMASNLCAPPVSDDQRGYDPDELISLETPNGVLECDITRQRFGL